MILFTSDINSHKTTEIICGSKAYLGYLRYLSHLKQRTS